MLILLKPRLFVTFQDRLIKEMRLVGVSSKEEANQFLEGSHSITKGSVLLGQKRLIFTERYLLG
ncbi:MAG: hypothetical protein SVW57_11545 [Thermodesulfobacteriota bacterium]|nr:hypothetical protein [Thermodesulfobacteriota bacterium]